MYIPATCPVHGVVNVAPVLQNLLGFTPGPGDSFHMEGNVLPCPVPGCPMPAQQGTFTMSPDGRVTASLEAYGIPKTLAGPLLKLAEAANNNEAPQEEIEARAEELHPKAPALLKLWHVIGKPRLKVEISQDNLVKVLCAGLAVLAAQSISVGDVALNYKSNNTTIVNHAQDRKKEAVTEAPPDAVVDQPVARRDPPKHFPILKRETPPKAAPRSLNRKERRKQDRLKRRKKL